MVEIQVVLDRFGLEHYQRPFYEAIEKQHYKRALCIWPRRSGKDIVAFNLAIRALLRNQMACYYIFPTYAHGKKILWDSLDNEGHRILDWYIPEQLISSKNSQEMKLRFKNGSLFQIIGSDSYNTSLIGTNPKFVVFSEYALQDPEAYHFVRPILNNNGGTAIFVSTPRGKNHLWELAQIAEHSPYWFYQRLTLDDTNHIPLIEVERERNEGMSDELIRQEYYCDFTLGIEGSFYGRILDKMQMRGQIGKVPWEPQFPVHTAWDLGMRDATTIVFFQVVGQTIRIIDYYENSKQPLEHYINVVKSKDYSYGHHIAPHDIKVTDYLVGVTRWEKARDLGIKFKIAENIPVIDGIEAVRSMLNKTWIDEENCKQLIKALENYHQEYDTKLRTYRPNPKHDWSSHAADAVRYMAISLSKLRDGLTKDDLDKMYKDSRGGGGFSSVFKDPY